jgi:hypothetical protein
LSTLTFDLAAQGDDDMFSDHIVWASNDGLTWEEVFRPERAGVLRQASDRSFVVIWSGGAATSTDGSTWEASVSRGEDPLVDDEFSLTYTQLGIVDGVVAVTSNQVLYDHFVTNADGAVDLSGPHSFWMGTIADG